MTDYAEKHVYPEARILMLQLMDAAPGGETSAQMITTQLQGTPTVLWFDDVVAQLNWLKNEELCEVTENPDVILAKISRKGSLAARGLRRHKGIDRPRREV